MFGWDIWKKSFDQAEEATARYVEQWLRSPLVLVPGTALLGAAMKAKAVSDKASAQWWSSMGLPTRRDQERTLHLLNELQSRLLDLEEQLADAKARAPKED
jgi:hypothetical protein